MKLPNLTPKIRFFILALMFSFWVFGSYLISFYFLKMWMFKVLTFVGVCVLLAETGINFRKYFPSKSIKINYKDVDGKKQEKIIKLNTTTHYINESELKGFHYSEVKNGRSSKKTDNR